MGIFVACTSRTASSYQFVEEPILRLGFSVDVFRDLLQEFDPICDGVDPTVVLFFRCRFHVVRSTSLRRSFPHQRRSTAVSVHGAEEKRTTRSVPVPHHRFLLVDLFHGRVAHLVPRLMPLCLGPSPTALVLATRSPGPTRHVSHVPLGPFRFLRPPVRWTPRQVARLADVDRSLAKARTSFVGASPFAPPEGARPRSGGNAPASTCWNRGGCVLGRIPTRWDGWDRRPVSPLAVSRYNHDGSLESPQFGEDTPTPGGFESR